MDSLDIRVLSDALAWRTAGHAVTLVTVVQTWGSAPRPPGALLAVREDGLVSGSVSGGCVEDDLIARTKAAFTNLVAHSATVAAPAQSPVLPSEIVYGVSKEEATRFGLPCGGTLRLVHEPLQDAAWITELVARTSAHQLVSRHLNMATGAVVLGVSLAALAGVLLAPLAGVEDLLQLVHWPHASACVLVVGHQPTIGQAIAQLLAMPGQTCVVKKGAVWWLRYRERHGEEETTVLSVQSPDLL
jgi:xanthine/CO dehydrogenase XdhC/CoxF family maturation factor